MVKLITTALAIFLGIYTLVVLITYFFQEKLIFFPNDFNAGSTVLSKFRDAEISFSQEGVNLQGWWSNPGRSKIIIYYGGNAEEVSGNLPSFANYAEYSILLMNYRGFGKSEGSPGQDELFSDAMFIFDQVALRNYSEIILFGRSLGSGIAIYIAAHRPVSKLILVTPYDSILNIARSHYPFLPVKLLLKHPFLSEQYAKKISVPVLVLRAAQDRVIPPRNTLKLLQSFGANCRAVAIENTDHNSIQISSVYWQEIETFLKNDHHSKR